MTEGAPVFGVLFAVLVRTAPRGLPSFSHHAHWPKSKLRQVSHFGFGESTKIAYGAAWSFAVATSDWRRRRAAFRTIEQNAQKAAIETNQFKITSSVHVCPSMHEEQSRQTAYGRLTALPVWARLFGKLSGRRPIASATESRHQTRSLSLIAALRVNSGTDSPIGKKLILPLRKFNRLFGSRIDHQECSAATGIHFLSEQWSYGLTKSLDSKSSPLILRPLRLRVNIAHWTLIGVWESTPLSFLTARPSHCCRAHHSRPRHPRALAGLRPELNPIETVWEYLRCNKPPMTVFDDYDDIVDKTCAAWNFVADDPKRIASITTRS